MTVPGQEALKYTYDEANRLKELKRGSAERVTSPTTKPTCRPRPRYPTASKSSTATTKQAS